MLAARAVPKVLSARGAAEVIAGLGALVFFTLSAIYTHTQASILDEGAYLYKGWLYASGQYSPFRDYGPWGNHMPLSFLIPGYVQLWFGAGLRTGRYFSLILGLLLLLGLWLAASRLGGRWWGAAAVWAVALNPAQERIYSLAFSQVLVACLLVWLLVLVLEERPSTLRLALGGALGGALLMTRLNMVVLLPLLAGYVFWQHGKRAGAVVALSGGLVVLLLHALYWPGIMHLWASWLPVSLTPFLDAWRGADLGAPRWNPSVSIELRWLSFWFGMRYNFLPMLALFGLGLLWLWPRAWARPYERRAAAFLSLLVASLTAAHAWAALGKNYCVFCYSGYLTFFTPAALLLIIVTWRGWQGGRSRLFGVYAALLVLALTTGIGFSGYQDTGPWLLELPFPRIKGGRFAGGTAPLRGLLDGGLGISYERGRILLPVLAGLVVGVMILLLAWFLVRRARASGRGWHGFGWTAFGLLLAAGLALSPTIILGAGYRENDCSGDVIAAEQAAGSALARAIPDGSQVYWQGTLSAVPLLYAPQVHIYPPQINDGYSFHLGGDPGELLKSGLWNADLVERWKQEADFIVIEARRYDADWKAFLESGQFDELPRTPATAPCRDNSALRIFRRKAPGS